MMKLLTVLLLSVVPILVNAAGIDDIDVFAWGYQGDQHHKYNEKVCAVGFEPEFIEYREIKSLASSKELAQTYHRFTLIREFYGTPAGAQARIEFVNSKVYSDSRFAKECAIWDGFRVGQNIYLVHTDVAIFSQELANIVAKLRTEVYP